MFLVGCVLNCIAERSYPMCWCWAVSHRILIIKPAFDVSIPRHFSVMEWSIQTLTFDGAMQTLTFDVQGRCHAVELASRALDSHGICLNKNTDWQQLGQQL